ncbi:MAG: hypothetical protein GC161_17785 [Planctomycetaceae bacterium]|nr:hypothetical protein [Planctomycetaceae bacterium]
MTGSGAWSLGPGAFAPEFRALVAALDRGERPRVAGPVPGAFAFAMLAPDAAAELLAEIDRRAEAAARRGQTAAAPNSMHLFGAQLGPLGFDPWLRELCERWVAPLARALLPEFAGAPLDRHHGYLVDYARHRDQDLGFHVDDSEVTLNLCLGEDFDGAELNFLGVRCEAHRDGPVLAGETAEYLHRPGAAVLHAGAHRHRVEPIRRGRRRNLILWCQSAALRADGPPERPCAPWCGAWTAAATG